MKIKEFELVNDEKFNRAIFGKKDGSKVIFKGVGEDATDEEKIACYDKLGGLILKDGVKVKMGSFYDFETKKARTEPEIIFESVVEGTQVELSEDEAKAVLKAKKIVSKVKQDKAKKSKNK